MRKTMYSLAALALASVGFSQSVVFNAMPSGTYFTGADVNLNESGEWFQTNQTAPFALGGFNLDFVTSGSGTENFTDLRLMVQVYGSGASTYTASSAAEFTSLLGSVTYDFGSQSLAAGYYYDLGGGSEVTLPTPITTTDASGRVGVVFTWLNGSAAATGIENAVRISSAPSVGSNAETDYNLMFGVIGGTGTGSPTQAQYLYTGTIPSNMAVELFSAPPTPEPVSMTFLGLGVAGLVARRRRR